MRKNPHYSMNGADFSAYLERSV